ncbi:MAG TPA: hypothetical protein VH497_17970 [Vicinamibacterales bacterium]|jgi:hypothetical protein
MTAKTRYFVIVSLLVLGVGLGTGLVAYYVGFPAGAFARAGGPDELQFVPRNATLIAYADVRDIMTSELRQKLHSVIPVPAEGQHEFEEKTGINIETDIDHVVACVNPDRTSASSPGSGLVLARGRFNETKIESLMREHGAQVEDYRGKRLIAGTAPSDRGESHEFAAAFLEPGLAALGSTRLVRSAIDLHQTGDNPQAGLQSVTGNEELMNLVKSLEAGNNFWAVGRFDALQTQAHLPQEVTTRLPAITWFAASGHVNGGLRGVLRAETRDEEAANNLRDVVRGFLALGKMQAGSRPDIQAMMQSLELSGTGKTVALSFTVPAAVFDVIGDVHKDRQRKPIDR